MKRSFTILELIIVVLILSILYTSFTPKTNTNNIHELKNRLILQLKYLRYKALTDSKYDELDSKWHKERWSFKIFNCDKNKDGVYYAMYSDTNNTGSVAATEALDDPLSNKNIYTGKQCIPNNSNSKYVLLTDNFKVKEISSTCNSTDAIVQISFGFDGNVYTRLSKDEGDSYNYRLEEKCIINIVDNDSNELDIVIENKTGFIY